LACILKPFHYGANPDTLARAKALRKSLTAAENWFWQMVRNRNMLGLKFRRQHPIDRFIVDFYCHELKLVLEIDGNIHDLPEIKKYVKEREDYLIGLGLEVLRFKNEDVFFNPHVIEQALSTRLGYNK
jgi:very-short-patch-repair endonuclease